METQRNALLRAAAWIYQRLQRYGILLAALLILPLTFGPALAQSQMNQPDASSSAAWVGTMIATILMTFVSQRAWNNAREARDKAQDANKSVQKLNKELGVDDPATTTPDIMQMQKQVEQLRKDLSTLQNELTRTLEERDTAREQVVKQNEINAENSLKAQSQIDRLNNDLQGERETSARLEQQLTAYDQRFREQELEIAHIKGRLDQQGVQEQWSNTMQTIAKLLNDTSIRLIGGQPEGAAT